MSKEAIKITKIVSKDTGVGNPLVVQWLGFCAFTVEVKGLIPGQGTKIPQVVGRGQKKKRTQESI